ncbi:MAG: phage portal protein, partial [Wolbachia endosymbiont of Pissodes strobi]|nr:phage portal protein [Wolbachia endosymbiont of Pissodes strobi]
PLRPGQIRGVPWLSSVLLKLYELDQYDDAELVRKKTAAMFAGFITRLDPEANIMGEGESNEQGVALSGLEPGTMQLLDPGEDIKFSEPSDVGGSYEAFMKQQLRAIAVGMGITYEQLTGDLTNVNYSSIRAGLIEFRRRCGMLQHNIMVFQFCRPVWDRWLELALLSGELDIGKEWTKKGGKEEVKWIAQGFDWVDPLKDQQAQQMAVRNGFK